MSEKRKITIGPREFLFLLFLWCLLCLLAGCCTHLGWSLI